MRPGTMRAIPKRHQHPKQQVQRNRPNGHEADVGRDVEDRYSHGLEQWMLRIGHETAQSVLMFHENLFTGNTERGMLSEGLGERGLSPRVLLQSLGEPLDFLRFLENRNGKNFGGVNRINLKFEVAHLGKELRYRFAKLLFLLQQLNTPHL